MGVPWGAENFPDGIRASATETAKIVRRITDTGMDGGIMDTGTSMGVSDPETAGLPGGRTGIDKKDLLLQEILKKTPAPRLR